MKKRGILAITIGLMCLLSGCSKFSPDESAVSVNKNGDITGVAVENLDKDYYDETELDSMVQKEVDGYVAKNGKGSVKLGKLKVSEKKAKLEMSYASPKDYAQFNKVQFYVGKVSDAEQAGGTFSGRFKSVEDGKIVKSGLTNKDVMGKDYQVVVLEESVLVQVPGNILFVSDNVDVKSKNQAKVLLAADKVGSETEVQSEQTEASETEMLMISPEPVEAGAETATGKKLAYIIYE